jgi:hypothetical protein
MTRRIPAGEPGLSQGGRKRYDGKSLPPVADNQQTLLDLPRARNRIDRQGRLHRDPETSFQAAASQSTERVTAMQRAVYNTLQLAREPLTDEVIVERVQRITWGAAASGIRSRRAELVRKGLLEIADHNGVTSHGQRCRRYQIARRAD